MNILIMMVPIALTLVILFVVLFVLATRSGQMDDLETPAHSIFYNEEEIKRKISNDKQ